MNQLLPPPLLADVWQYVFGTLMFLTALFLILLVLVQRGRGGGLAGAFGGMGGQSAFGTKAGDLFTKITMFVATFWILLCVASIAVLNSQRSVFGTGAGPESGGIFETGESPDAGQPLGQPGVTGGEAEEPFGQSPPEVGDPAAGGGAAMDPAEEELPPETGLLQDVPEVPTEPAEAPADDAGEEAP